MSISLTQGSTVVVASAYGTARTIVDISNAAEAVMTMSDSSHGFAAGDYVEATSGWDLLSCRVVRVKTVSAAAVTLEGLDTTDTSRFPPGAGAGTAREITTWTGISQIKGVSSSGGSPEYIDVTTIADRVKKQIPTTVSATEITFSLFNDPTLPHVATVNAASEKNTPIAMRINFANGGKYVGNYYCIAGVPQLNAGDAILQDLTFSSVARPIQYAT